MDRKANTGKVADIKKRLEETTAKTARVKAATEKMEDTVHQLENLLHKVEKSAKHVYRKIRKDADQIHQRPTR